MAVGEAPTIIIKKIKKGGAAGHHGGAWKVAYADFVTAMMAFFLVMWICGQDQQVRKAVSYYRFRERKVERSWQGVSERPTYDDAKEIAGTLIEAFVNREVDEIFGVFTDYVSALTQRAEARRFLPLVVEDVETTEQGPYPLYLFEPDPQTILDALVPRYVEMRVFAALLESARLRAAVA